MAVLVVVDDLLFLSTIEAAAAHAGVALHIAKDLTTLTQQLNTSPGGRSLAIVDLNLSASDPMDVLTAIRRAAPEVPLLAFCAHVQTDLQAKAQHAGCSVVLPRSAFVKRLPELLKGQLRAPDAQRSTPRRNSTA